MPHSLEYRQSDFPIDPSYGPCNCLLARAGRRAAAAFPKMVTNPTSSGPGDVQGYGWFLDTEKVWKIIKIPSKDRNCLSYKCFNLVCDFGYSLNSFMAMNRRDLLSSC